MRDIINMLKPHLTSHNRRHRISKQLRILAAIRFFAVGSYQRCVGQDSLINLSQSQISLLIGEIASAIENNLQHIIQFPAQDEYTVIKERIMRRYNVPGVIGFVDGTHIALCKPNAEREHQYLNRKGFHSKNVQIICDDNYKILSINAAYSGASHDAYIFRNSSVNEILERLYTAGDKNSWLLGDSGYPLMPYLFTPIRSPPNNSPSSRYNFAHRRARSSVERCIGIMKARFRCLLYERVLKYCPEKAGTIINACAILHNIMSRNLPLPPEIELENNIICELANNDYDDNEHRLANFAEQNRARIVQTFFH